MRDLSHRLYISGIYPSLKIVRIGVCIRFVPFRIVRTGIYNQTFFSIMYVDSQYYDDWACSRGISIITILKKRVGLYIIGSLIIYNRSLINPTLIIYNIIRLPIIYNQTSDHI
jgi:hypothetical protein